MTKSTIKVAASETARKSKISGAAESSINRKADAVIARMSKPKSPR